MIPPLPYLRRNLVRWPLLIGVAATLLLTRGVWQMLGFPSFVDLNLPPDLASTLTSIGRFANLWDWYANGGRPNPNTQGEVILLGLYLPLVATLGGDGAVKCLVPILVAASYGAMYFSLRRLGRSQRSATIGALFAMLNPWFYDEVAQGHVYFLMVSPLLTIVLLAQLAATRWSFVRWFALTVALMGVFVIDFHYTLVALVGIVVAILLDRRRVNALGRIAMLASAGVASLWIYGPSTLALAALRVGNSPDPSSLASFSKFTSFIATLTLLRPGQNADAAIASIGGIYAPCWFVAAVILLVWTVRSLSTQFALERPILIAWVAIGVVVGEGLNAPFGALNAILIHVPIVGETLRDPTKAFVLIVISAAFVLSGRIDIPNFRMPATLADAWRDLSGYVLRTPLPSILVFVAFVAYVVPALVISFGSAFAINSDTLSQSVATADRSADVARASGGRYAYVPSGVLVRYEDKGKAIYDPVRIFPTAPTVRLSVDYDHDRSSMMARYALAGLDANLLADPAESLAELGVNSIALLPQIPFFDNDAEDALFDNTGPLAQSAPDISFANANGTVDTLGLAVGDDALTEVDRDARGVDVARVLHLLPRESLWAFTNDAAPPVRPDDELAALDAPAPGIDISGDTFERGGWTRSWDDWALDGAAALRLPQPPLRAVGSAQSVARYALPSGRYTVYAHVLATTPTSDLRVTIGRTVLSFHTSARVGGAEFTWVRGGDVSISQPGTLELTNAGQRAVVDVLRFVPRDAISNVPTVHLGHMGEALQTSDAGVTPERAPSGYGVVVQEAKHAITFDFAQTLSDEERTFYLHGYVTGGGRVTIRVGAESCVVPLAKSVSVGSCRVHSGGPLRVSVSRGTFVGDAIAFAPTVLANRLATSHHPVRVSFRPGDDRFSVSSSMSRYTAVLVSASPLWKLTRPTIGSAFGYAMLFENVGRSGVDGFISTKRFQVFLAIVGIGCAVLIGLAFAFWTKRQSSTIAAASERAHAPS